MKNSIAPTHRNSTAGTALEKARQVGLTRAAILKSAIRPPFPELSHTQVLAAIRTVEHILGFK